MGRKEHWRLLKVLFNTDHIIAAVIRARLNTATATSAPSRRKMLYRTSVVEVINVDHCFIITIPVPVTPTIGFDLNYSQISSDVTHAKSVQVHASIRK